MVRKVKMEMENLQTDLLIFWTFEIYFFFHFLYYRIQRMFYGHGYGDLILKFLAPWLTIFLGLSAIILIWPQILVSAEFMVLILIFVWIKFIDF